MSNIVNRTNSIFFGLLMGFCIPLFIWVLIFEHIAIFILLPIFPVIGVLLGLILGSRGKIPPLKVWVSLLIFTIFIGITIGYSDARGLIMRLQRERIASELSEQYTGSRIIEKEYSSGNGMEEPPNVKIVIENDDSFERIARNYDTQFKDNGWKMRHGVWQKMVSWRKGNYEVFLYKNDEDYKNKTIYSLRVDYLGYWMTHFRSI